MVAVPRRCPPGERQPSRRAPTPCRSPRRPTVPPQSVHRYADVYLPKTRAGSFNFPFSLFVILSPEQFQLVVSGSRHGAGGRGTWAHTVQLHRRGATFTWGRSVLGRVPARHRRGTWRGAEAGGTSCGRLVFAQENVQIITDAWKSGGITQVLGAGWDRHRDAWEQDGRCPWQQLMAVLSRGPPPGPSVWSLMRGREVSDGGSPRRSGGRSSFSFFTAGQKSSGAGSPARAGEEPTDAEVQAQLHWHRQG